MKFFVLAASLRQQSVNKVLIKQAAEFLQQASHDVDLADMHEFEVPLYNQDEEDKNGVPAGALRMVERMDDADAVIFSVPEYNFSIPGVFKNQIDWISRMSSQPWRGKCIALMSASPSMVGGNRGLWATRIPLEGCGAIVHPDMFSLAAAFQSFDDNGHLKDEALEQRLQKALSDFAAFAGKLA